MEEDKIPPMAEAGFRNDSPTMDCIIKVIGVGGGGCNAVEYMYHQDIENVAYVILNTDRQQLNGLSVPVKVGIGNGLGAGNKPEVAKQAAEESADKIDELFNDTTRMVFITGGMGGGTGTGAAPVVARVAKEMGILTVGIVTKPFAFEGKRRMEHAEFGISNLSEFVDSLVIIPNERLKQVSETRITLQNAFETSDGVLRHGVQSISELINIPQFVNLDFADVTSVMKGAGYAHMGVGHGEGKDKAERAAKEAISSPLLETTIKGATGILINITASPDIGLEDIDLASTMIANEAREGANIIWGAGFDPELEDAMNITIIATGFENEKEENAKRAIRGEAAPETAPKAEVKKSVPTSSAEREDVFAPTDEERKAEMPAVEPSTISEDDFNELIGMLKKPRSGGSV